MNEDAWENLDTWERRDHEPIKDHLNEAPLRLENDNWKLRMNKFWDDGLRMNKLKKTPELLRMGEKKFSQPKQLWEDGREWGKI